MLQNAYLLSKIGADSAENDRNLPKICQKFAKDWQLPYGSTTLRRPLERHATLDAPRLERRNSSEGLRPRTG